MCRDGKYVRINFGEMYKMIACFHWEYQWDYLSLHMQQWENTDQLDNNIHYYKWGLPA